MAKNNRIRKTIVWLEDHPDYFPELEELIRKTGFELVICRTLEEFRKAADNFQNKPELVQGFIVDVALRGNNYDLGALGLAHIKTHQGGVTGIQVVIHFLLGLHNKERGPFAEIPIAVLTVLEDSDKVFSLLVSPSPYARNDQMLAGVNRVKFIYKQNDSTTNGGEGDLSEIKQWLNGFEA